MLQQLGNFDEGCSDLAEGERRRSLMAGDSEWVHHASPASRTMELGGPSDLLPLQGCMRILPCRRGVHAAGEQPTAAVDAGHLHAQLWARGHGICIGFPGAQADRHTG